MNDLFYEELLILENANIRINTELDNAIVTYTESFYNKHYITEKETESLYTSLKKFFLNLITSIRLFYKQTTTKIKNFIRENTIDIKLRKLRKDLEKNKNNGAKYVECIDLIKYKRTYLVMVDELWYFTNKFAKGNYKSVKQLDRDMELFEKLYNKYEDQLDEIENYPIRIPIKKAIDFVSKEIDGKSDVIETINNCANRIEELEVLADNIQLKRDNLGKDVIPKHVNFIRKMCNKITSIIRKKVSKFISVVVFLFA